MTPGFASMIRDDDSSSSTLTKDSMVLNVLLNKVAVIAVGVEFVLAVVYIDRSRRREMRPLDAADMARIKVSRAARSKFTVVKLQSSTSFKSFPIY